VAELLRTFELQVLAYDPYVDRDTATELGVELVELSELFARSFVVSNHLPNIPATEGLLDGTLFVTMRPDATFINTGRGAQVVEGELIDILRRRPDVTALLDVTLPEPPEPESAFYTLPNVQLSSHIAGSMNDELVRMADHMIEECARWQRGEALRYQVTEAMLQTMA
jgi:phosphoglycerate dehydrogenase-like enzyme